LSIRHDPRAITEFEQAIVLEKKASRIRVWIEEFIPRAIASGKRDLARKHLQTYPKFLGDTATAYLEAAQKMIKYEFNNLALETLSAASKLSPPPEVFVDIEMAAASAEVGLNQMDKASSRLDQLLARITGDYWRRPEIMRRRIALVKTDEEREQMIEEGRKRWESAPHDESLVLDLAFLQESFELRRDALETLLQASEQLPSSMPIEVKILELYDRLWDEQGRETYLAKRCKIQSNRQDLVRSHMHSLFLLGRREVAFTLQNGALDEFGVPPYAGNRHL